MKYEHLVSYVASELWAIRPEKLTEIVSALAFRAAGGTLSAEEIQARIGDKSAPMQSRGKAVAIVPIRGTITHRGGGMAESSGGTSTESIAAMFRQAMADEQVGTILFDVDSPGGTVTGVAELAAEIFAARGQKRMIAQVNGLAASAAYWLASQADEIVSIASGETGSIGVFVAHQDLSAALEKEGIKVTLIKAGKHKGEMLPFAPLSEESLAFLQGRVDDAYEQFVGDVARGRGVTPAQVRAGYGEGRVLAGKAAKAAGLVDRIAQPETTIKRLLGQSGGVRAEADVSIPEAVMVSRVCEETECLPSEAVAAIAAAAPDDDDAMLRRLEF
jgi:signal peptide peptidase SppA